MSAALARPSSAGTRTFTNKVPSTADSMPGFFARGVTLTSIRITTATITKRPGPGERNLAGTAHAGYAAAMSVFPVSPEKEAQLYRRMVALGVRETDIEETFVRSAGHGGQNVNKTATCVMLLHRPSRLRVKYQTTRRQGLNRFLARRLLLDKIEALQKGHVDAERARIQKIRRQKRRRSRRAKQRMLADKVRHAAKKESRRAVAPEEA
jgi:hypothetical protein